jgi:membrane protein
MLLGIGFLLLVSMAMTIMVNSFTYYIGGVISVPGWTVPALEAVASFLITSVLFALILKFLPDAQTRWKEASIGGVVTAILFTAGKFLLGFYLSHEIGASAYGAGSAFIVILLYVYYASLILYLGAEFTKVYACHCGAGIRPSRYAVRDSRGNPPHYHPRPANRRHRRHRGRTQGSQSPPPSGPHSAIGAA